MNPGFKNFLGQLANRGRSARTLGDARKWEAAAKSSLQKTGSPQWSATGQKRFADASTKYEQYAGKYNQQMGDWENYLATLSPVKRVGARVAGGVTGFGYDLPRIATFNPAASTGLMGGAALYFGVPVASNMAFGREFNPDIFGRAGGMAHAATRGKADATAYAQMGAEDAKNEMYSMYFNGSNADRRNLLSGNYTKGILSQHATDAQRSGLRAGSYRPTQSVAGSTFWGNYTPEMYKDLAIGGVAPHAGGMMKQANAFTSGAKGAFGVVREIAGFAPKNLAAKVNTSGGKFVDRYRSLPEGVRRNVNRFGRYGIPTLAVGGMGYAGWAGSRDAAREGGYAAGQLGAYSAADSYVNNLGGLSREMAVHFPNLAYNFSNRGGGGAAPTPAGAPQKGFSYTPTMYYRPNGEAVYPTHLGQ